MTVFYVSCIDVGRGRKTQERKAQINMIAADKEQMTTGYCTWVEACRAGGHLVEYIGHVQFRPTFSIQRNVPDGD